MAGSALKKTVLKNKKILRNFLIQESFFLAIYLLLVYLKNNKVTLLNLLPELLVVYYIYKLSKPKYINNKLIDSGVDLDSRGVVAILFDYVYISWVTKMVVLWSSLGYLLYFLFCFGVFYELKGIFSMKK